jgi:hypothetical protein
VAATSIPIPADSWISRVLNGVRTEPAYAAFLILRIGFVLLPLIFGLDKFVNVLTNWEAYLAPWFAGLLPVSGHTAMLLVGAVEILAGILVAIKPRYAAYVVALWLAGIIINLLTYPGFYDIALRDVGLLLAALALAQLARTFDPRPGVRNQAQH